jgi:hypothetical protein
MKRCLPSSTKQRSSTAQAGRWLKTLKKPNENKAFCEHPELRRVCPADPLRNLAPARGFGRVSTHRNTCAFIGILYVRIVVSRVDTNAEDAHQKRRHANQQRHRERSTMLRLEEVAARMGWSVRSLERLCADG